MAADGTNGLRAARPIVRVADQDRPTLAQGLLALLIVEQATGLYRCEALFGNWGERQGNIGFLYFDRAVLEFGKALAIKIGADTIFDGRIMALSANYPEGRPPEMNVLAEDRFQDLRMVRRTRTFVDVSDGDVMKQIATDHGLRQAIDVTGPTHKVLAQVNQSDLAFLRERARAIDAELWMDGSTLHVKSHADRAGQAVKLTYGKELREFTALSDLAGQRTSVAVNGWDVAAKAALQYEATEAAIRSELNGDDSGASILQAAYGERKEALAHTVPLNSDEAKTRAEAFFRTSARRFVTGKGVAQADASLRVGSAVELIGLGPLFSGKYYLAEVRYLFDGANGMRVQFTAERPGLGKPQ